MSELVHLASLFNPKIHEAVSSFLHEIPWESEVAVLLAEKFQSDFPSVGDTVLKSALTGRLIEEEYNLLVDCIKEYRSIESKEDVIRIANEVFDFYQKGKLKDILSRTSDDIPLLIKKLKELPESISAGIEVHTLGMLDPDKVFEEDIGGHDGILPTNFDIIRKATPFNGYIPGQVVQWVAPPGVGKSAAMLYEASRIAMDNKKVLWIALGDLMRFDFVTRFATIMSQTEYFEVALHPSKYFNSDIREVANNFDLITVPSKSLNSEQIKDLVKNCRKRYDLVVLDYDSNVATDNESMYHAGGDIYDALTSIARPMDQRARLVFVACQPKIQYWGEEKLPEESAGESARKQHVIDIMVTFGKADSDHRCGIMSLAKVRRGTCMEVPYQITKYGHFKEINSEQYAMMKRYGSRKR